MNVEFGRIIRRRVGKPVKNLGKAVMVSSAVRSKPEGVVFGAGIYGTGRVIEGRKRKARRGDRVAR